MRSKCRFCRGMELNGARCKKRFIAEPGQERRLQLDWRCKYQDAMWMRAVSLGSKMPDDPSRHKNVVLPALAGINIELRYARPKIARFSPHAKVSVYRHI